MTDNPVFTQIENDLKSNPVVLYMKGTQNQPMCGFSNVVVQALGMLGVTDIKDINVLADEEVRQGIKDYNNWPTIPQLFVKGEFVGGADIIREMYQSGELKTLLEEKGILSA